MDRSKKKYCASACQLPNASENIGHETIAFERSLCNTLLWQRLKIKSLFYTQIYTQQSSIVRYVYWHTFAQKFRVFVAARSRAAIRWGTRSGIGSIQPDRSRQLFYHIYLRESFQLKGSYKLLMGRSALNRADCSVESARGAAQRRIAALPNVYTNTHRNPITNKCVRLAIYKSLLLLQLLPHYSLSNCSLPAMVRWQRAILSISFENISAIQIKQVECLLFAEWTGDSISWMPFSQKIVRFHSDKLALWVQQ